MSSKPEENLGKHYEAMQTIQATARDLSYISKCLMGAGNGTLATELQLMVNEVESAIENARNAFTEEIMGRHYDGQQASTNMVNAALAGIALASEKEPDCQGLAQASEANALGKLEQTLEIEKELRERERTKAEYTDKIARQCERQAERIEQLEAALRVLWVVADTSNLDAEMALFIGGVVADYIANDSGDFRDARGSLSAGDSLPCEHEWDYTGSEASCTRCQILSSENPCKHLSISPPTFGAWRCCDCNMTFSERPQTDGDKSG